MSFMALASDESSVSLTRSAPEEVSEPRRYTRRTPGERVVKVRKHPGRAVKVDVDVVLSPWREYLLD